MRIEKHITLVLCITLWPLINVSNANLPVPAAEQSLHKLESLVAQYSGKLGQTIQLIKDNKISESGLELGEVKKSLTKITSFLQTDNALKGIPVFKELMPQLAKLTLITKSLDLENLLTGDKLMGVVDKLKNAFSILGQVTSKITSGVN